MFKKNKKQQLDGVIKQDFPKLLQNHIENIDYIISCFEKQFIDENTFRESIWSYVEMLTNSLNNNQALVTISDKEHDFFKESISSPNAYDFWLLRDQLSRRIDLNINLFNCPTWFFLWDNQRILDNLIRFSNANRIFNFKHGNIDNQYVYPIGVILVDSGNHSQYAASLRKRVSQHVHSVFDISRTYNEWHFDGINIIDQNGNVSEVFQRRLGEKRTSEDFFLAGVLFEIGRKLKDYPLLFPIEILNQI